MNIQPFTDSGVKIKVQELYKLPDDALRQQTENLRIDFRSWMLEHFELNEEQRKYLESMEYPFTQILAEDLADCIAFRLPLKVNFGDKVFIGSKFIKIDNKLLRDVHPIKGYQVTGELAINIIYEG